MPILRMASYLPVIEHSLDLVSLEDIALILVLAGFERKRLGGKLTRPSIALAALVHAGELVAIADAES